MTGTNQIRALCLLSGGLDSQLAVCVVREQGIAVEGVTFDSPFFNIDPARKAARQLGIALHVVDFTAEILSLLNDPPHGFGSGMNPCIDCHSRMLKQAGEMLKPMGFQFLCTGEVLDERPMSQTRVSLHVVARDSGFEGLVLRPLSAGLLPETIPEKEKWIDRSRFLSLRGRSRRPQMELAQRYGLTDYPQPAGGCCLTEPNFSRRLRELQGHEGIGDLQAIRLLKVGRHFRLSDRVKLVVGRNQQDNLELERLAGSGDFVLKAQDVPGPIAWLPATAGEAEILKAAAICARYCDAGGDQPLAVSVRAGGNTRILRVSKASEDELGGRRI